MSQVVRMPGKHSTLIKTLEELLEQVKNGEDVSFIFASRDSDGESIVSWYDGDGGLAERQYLVSTLQMEVTMGVVESYLHQLIEEG